jgi:hypothetical protein
VAGVLYPHRTEDSLDIAAAQWEARLQHGIPSLKAGLIDLLEELDVHQIVPDLDIVPELGGNQICLFALLYAGRLECCKAGFSDREACVESSPLPSLYERGSAVGHADRVFERGVSDRPTTTVEQDTSDVRIVGEERCEVLECCLGLGLLLALEVDIVSLQICPGLS